MSTHTLARLLFSSLIGFGAAQGQDATPSGGGIVDRVFMLVYGNEYGTSFLADVDGKQYLITADHVVKGLPDTGGVVQFFRTDARLENVPVEVDIAILVLGMHVPAGNLELSANTFIGKEVYFYGFPATPSGRLIFTKILGNVFPAPFIKKAILSAADNSVADRRIFYFDGFNNKGFSGGPIAWFNTTTKKWQVVAVVSGYVNSVGSVKAVPTPSQKKAGRKKAGAPVQVQQAAVSQAVLANSGILIGFSTDSALAAIRKYTSSLQ